MSRALVLVRPGLLWFVLSSAIGLVGGLPARAQPAPPQAPRTAGEAEATPCRPDSAPHREATRALAALSAQIEALAPAADHAPASAALTALLAHPCLRLADFELADELVFDSAASLKEFWKEGGADWLQAYLDHVRAASDGGGSIVLPAAPRPTLSKETHPGHDLTPLLCSLIDADCGVRTRGWVLRAGDALERSVHVDDAERAACERKARRERPARRYAVWRECMDDRVPKAMALPLGGLDAPADGWLVIHGRRGHYEFCDEIRAYDLATGAAYVAQRCDGLIRLWTGEEGDADAGRVKAQAGQVLCENLREAAWMILTAPFAGEPAVRSTRYLDLPKGISLRRSARAEPPRRVIVTSSDQTALAWSYVRHGAVLATGTLTWPSDHNNTARAHAVRLLQITEAAFVPGCPRAALPAGLISTARLGDRPGVSPLDASADALDRTALDLAEALQRLGTSAHQDPGCRRAPARSAPSR